MQVPVKTATDQLFFVEVEGVGVGSPSILPADFDASLVPDGGAMGAADKVLDPTLFSRAVEVIQGLSQEVTAGLLRTDPRPSEVEMSLSLGFDASGNVWLLKGGAKANFELTLKWKLP